MPGTFVSRSCEISDARGTRGGNLVSLPAYSKLHTFSSKRVTSLRKFVIKHKQRTVQFG